MPYPPEPASIYATLGTMAIVVLLFAFVLWSM